jgi:hypothetical protein
LLHGADREIDRAVTGHDEDGHRRVDPAQAREEIERLAVGEAQVRHDDVGARAHELTCRGLARVGLGDVEAEVAQARGDPEAHGRIVLHHEHGRACSCAFGPVDHRERTS